MKLRLLGLCFALSWVCFSADKGPLSVRGENKLFTIEADLYRDKGEVEQVLGHQVEEGLVVVSVTITPKEPFKIWRDDFLLRSDKDGQRSEPYDPGQLASSSVLVVSYSRQGGGVMQQENGPVWGGMGGRQPGRLGGSGVGSGNSATVQQADGAEMSDDPEEAKTSPLLATLRERVLEEKEISAPVSGLLYFPLDGKHKDKHLWLHYTGKAGKIDMQFKQD